MMPRGYPLTQEDREKVWTLHLEEWTAVEIAREMGLTRPSVSNLLTRKRRQLEREKKVRNR